MKKAYAEFSAVCDNIRNAGLWKEERVLKTPQGSHIDTTEKPDVLNLCANNYLGFSNHPALIEAARESYCLYGHGLSSVRFICGTQTIHKQLESRMAAFLGMEDVILYSSCFDANTGLFETLLGEPDAIISDALNHASIIDGVRLCKARRLRYANNDMTALEGCLREAADARIRLIVTDGVFSMDGSLANLPAICDLAERHDALVMLGDARVAQEMARRMLEKGVYVVGFFYPVVPEGKARIRTQISAAHSMAELDTAVQAFVSCREQMRKDAP